MADFCNQCNDMMFGPDCPSDMAGLTAFGDQMAGLYAIALCEDCGAIQVDYLGNCISHIYHKLGLVYETGKYDAPDRRDRYECDTARRPHSADPLGADDDASAKRGPSPA